jgi:hypothetical protein
MDESSCVQWLEARAFDGWKLLERSAMRSKQTMEGRDEAQILGWHLTLEPRAFYQPTNERTNKTPPGCATASCQHDEAPQPSG